MMNKITIGNMLIYAILIIFSFSFILPIIMMFSISISNEKTIIDCGYSLLPKMIDFEAYKKILANPHQIIQSYKITIFTSFAGTLLSLFIQSLMAYPLSRPNYKYRKIATIYIFFTMLFHGGLVPSYILNTQYLHLNNTVWIYIFPSLINAWNIIIMRTFFQGLPNGLVEASKIDGASEFRIYIQIILPLSKPVLATLGFMTLLGKWNDWNTALIYIRDADLYTLQYLLQRILREAEYVKTMANTAGGSLLENYVAPTESMRYAMAILAAGPMLIMFPFFQKYFTKGLTIGAVKG